MNLFVFIQLLFGFGFFIRVLIEIYNNKLLSSASLTKIGTFFLFWIGFGAVFLNFHSFFWLLWLYSPTVIVLISKYLLRKHRENQFQKHFLFFLNNILLKMKGGNSFRKAFLSVNHSNNEFFREKFKQMYNFVAFSQHVTTELQTGFLNEVLVELKAVDSQPHKAIQRLENFRRKLLIINKFRQKSGQVLRQIRLQALILTGLYVALFIFVTLNFGIQKHLNLVILSIFAFLLGLVGVFFMGRRMKWKI